VAQNTTYAEAAPISSTVINNEAQRAQAQQPAAPPVVNVDTTEIVTVLKQILAETSKPALVKLGDKFVSEIDSRLAMKRNILTNLDNSYGRFVR
jgi:hypothetical protein